MNESPCAICGGGRRQARVSVEHWSDGQLMIVRNVPAQVCDRCGERFFLCDIADFVYTKLQAGDSPDEILSIPAWDFDRAQAVAG